MKEKQVVNKIIDALRRRGVYVVKIHGGPYQQMGLPDLWCVWQGRLVCLEVKLPGEQPTPRQEHEIGRLRAAGATVAVVTSVDESIEQFSF
jgi:Holliday junction resolvase